MTNVYLGTWYRYRPRRYLILPFIQGKTTGCCYDSLFVLIERQNNLLNKNKIEVFHQILKSKGKFDLQYMNKVEALQ